MTRTDACRILPIMSTTETRRPIWTDDDAAEMQTLEDEFGCDPWDDEHNGIHPAVPAPASCGGGPLPATRLRPLLPRGAARA